MVQTESSRARTTLRAAPWRRWGFWVLAAVGLWALSRAGPPAPERFEAFYGQRWGPAIAMLLARSTGWLGFSLAELLIAGFVGAQLARLVRALWRTRVQTALPRLLRALAHAAAQVAVLVALFYVLWGLHYARAPLEERLHWGVGSAEALADSTQVIRLASEMVEVVNDLYWLAHGVEDLGQPSSAPPPDVIGRSLQVGWERATSQLGLPSAARWRYGPPKPLLISPLLHRLGLSGFYFPYTGEANYNRTIPDVSLPQTLAHEQAHQRGFAPEDEASFVGFVAAANAPDPYVRYAAHLFAQRQMLRALLPGRLGTVRELVRQRLPGVQRDVDAQREYWAQARGPAQTMARQVNDLYLRSHRVEGGVRSYAGSVELILRWAFERGGRFDFGRNPPHRESGG